MHTIKPTVLCSDSKVHVGVCAGDDGGSGDACIHVYRLEVGEGFGVPQEYHLVQAIAGGRYKYLLKHSHKD